MTLNFVAFLLFTIFIEYILKKACHWISYFLKNERHLINEKKNIIVYFVEVDFSWGNTQGKSTYISSFGRSLIFKAKGSSLQAISMSSSTPLHHHLHSSKTHNPTHFHFWTHQASSQGLQILPSRRHRVGRRPLEPSTSPVETPFWSNETTNSLMRIWKIEGRRFSFHGGIWHKVVIYSLMQIKVAFFFLTTRNSIFYCLSKQTKYSNVFGEKYVVVRVCFFGEELVISSCQLS